MISKYKDLAVTWENIYALEDKDAFFDSEMSSCSEDGMINVIRFFAQVGRTERNLEKDFCEFSFPEIVAMFETEMWSNRRTLDRNRSFLRSYIMWCKKVNKISGEPHAIERLKHEDIIGSIKFQRKFFSSLDELDDFMKEITTVALSSETIIDDAQFLPITTIMFLTWSGLEIEEIVALKKEDVLIQSSAVRVVSRKNPIVPIEPKVLDYCLENIEFTGMRLKAFKNLEVYKEANNNDYLIRLLKHTTNSTAPVNPVVINSIIDKIIKTPIALLDPDSKYYSKNPTLSTIRISGIFSRLYLYETKHGEIATENEDIIEKICFGGHTIKYDTKLSLLVNYRKWKKYYHG